jgi:hypothetical protein
MFLVKILGESMTKFPDQVTEQTGAPRRGSLAVDFTESFDLFTCCRPVAEPGSLGRNGSL